MSAPILSAYDYEMSIGQVRHLRAGFLDAGNNGKLQFRYVWPDGTVEWLDLVTGLTSVNFNFAVWWDFVMSQTHLLFVNGLPQIWEWSGGVTTFASASMAAGIVTSINQGITEADPNGFMLPGTFGGKNYNIGDILTLPGGDGTATVEVQAVSDKAIFSVAAVPSAPGTGYAAGEIIDVVGDSGFTSGGIVKVETVDGGGGVLTISLVSQGHNYSIGTNKATVSGTSGGGNVTGATPPGGTSGVNYKVGDSVTVSGGGSNANLTVASIDVNGGITSYSITNVGSGYTTASNVPVFGGSGTLGQVNITANVIVASGCTIHITEVDNGAISTVGLLTGGTGYSVASAIAATGGTGTGALMQILAISDNTLTKQGTTTWAEEGFYSIGTHRVTINGVVYTATGGWNTQTLTGVSPVPVVAVAGDVIFQTPEIVLNTNIGLSATMQDNLIEVFDQQLYLSSLVENQIFVSELNNYHDFVPPAASFFPTTGSATVLTANSAIRAFILQEDSMYVSAGLAQWYQITQDTVSTSVSATQSINVTIPVLHRLKTTGLQGAISQAFVSKNKNDVIFVSNEPIVNSLGRVDNVVLTPQIADLSFPIVNDINKYDFTDGSIFFWQNFILVAVPKAGLIRIYNMTKDTTSANPTNDPIHYWEAPYTAPISRFSVIDGDIYAHSYLVSETYKLFNGYNFNGHPIPALAVFAYQQYGVRPQNKSENEFYVEGYISDNATINMGINYELDGFGGQYNGTIVGTDTAIVQSTGGLNSLGKESLGKNPLGGDLVIDETNTNKFRVIKTFPRTPYYEASPFFGTTGIDFIWALIAFGPAQAPTSEGNQSITQ